MPSLYRLRDGTGDAGGMSDILRINPDTNELEILHNQRPRIGWSVQVGSIIARTFSHQDWWLTTAVSEIIEETSNYVRFKTINGSEYEWRA